VGVLVELISQKEKNVDCNGSTQKKYIKKKKNHEPKT